ncbi:amino acid ABC transporter ATP-binding protein [Fructilactobacillus sanfranciscensis]|uniref:amino acid ABC transporter ATP-binding protein n=1 Tax=Fructilactobacillus sanfranciscensis TaxID=1625 RepID=UPI0037576A26
MLSIKNLTKSYNGRTIFKDLSFTVAPGEVLTIVGPSGIGKTTFLNILAGLIPADSGSIELDGKELTIDGTRQGSEVGVIFQDFNLFPQYTVTENITLAPRIVAKEKKATYTKIAAELLADLDLTEHQNNYPFELSGGQKQRVAIARALAMKPGVLAYDEPTSGLDEASTERVTSIIQKLQSRNATQLVVTHDLPFAQSLNGKVLDFSKDVER